MKINLTNPWSLTVLPHRLWRSLTAGCSDLTCAADLPAPAAPATVEGAVTVPATVPGNFELDLFRAGLIPDPFFGTNIIDLRKLEDRHLFYVTTFDAPPDGTDRLILHF